MGGGYSYDYNVLCAQMLVPLMRFTEMDILHTERTESR
uniref:Uncharacterized protein n=1 Tax=Anguilla anguilla TaxID=7936 RepID=A0A0E9XL17_ANGAN